jgi:hypothetical protein
MSRRALLIGVGRYLHGYPDLTATVSSDLDLISNALKEAGVATQKRVGDSGAVVGYADLTAEISEFLRNADRDDDLLIYYTGHGHGSEGITYLVPSDARPPEPSDPLRYLVPVRFDADVKKSAARSVSFIVDACRTLPADAQLSLPGRHPPDLGQAATTVSWVAEPAPRTTIVYAASAGEAAQVLPGPGAASLFTHALAGLIAEAGNGVQLADLRRRLQEATSTLASTGGMGRVPAIEVALGLDVDPRRAFEFFATGPGAASGARWSGLLLPAAGGVAADDFGLHPDTPELTSLLRVLDQAEAAVPRLDGSSARATFAEPTLIDRLARTARLVLKRVKDQISGPELLLVLGVVASLEASVRTREVSDAMRTDQDVPGRLAMISPQLADAYPTFPEHTQRLLAAWCDHILALRVTIGGATGTLRTCLAGAIAAALGDTLALSPGELARDLVDCLHEQFLGRESDRSRGRYRREVSLPEPGRTAVVVNIHRVAALTRLIWLLAADTRLLAPELGLGLVQDELENDLRVTEALAPLAGLTWVNLGEVLDLALRVRSAPLDQALRRLTADITAFLVTATQADAPLHELEVPYAATATRLAALDNAFRLPHIQFELSAAETYQLLMGTNLYGDARLAIRELYQNAVDACHYRRWRMARTNPDALEDWHPEIVFATGTDRGGAYLECRDNGVGMSAYELRESFAKVGRRFRDLPEFLEETASWGSGEADGFRPISQFGIGVLSYFMLAERVVIKTVRSDPSGHLSDPLEVRVSSAAGLFRLAGQPLIRPQHGGTIVRLYLRPKFANLDLAQVLGKIIAAPTVDTTLRLGSRPSPGDLHWAAGELYDNGHVMTVLAAPDLGVYFHEGKGRALVNGIPLSAFGDSDGPVHGSNTFRLGGWSRSDALSGVTVSLDRRSNPQLSVDRGRLLSVDLPALQDLMVKAAARVKDWPDASVQWLLELFATLPAAGSAAFHRLRGRDLIAWQPRNLRQLGAETADGPAPPVIPATLGITVFDPGVLEELGHTRPWTASGGTWSPRDFTIPPPNRNAAAIYRERSRLLTPRGDRKLRNGFPAFDDHLIRLLTHPRGTLPNMAGGLADSAREQLPDSLSSMCQIATELEVSVGAAALYRWASGFGGQPTRLALTRLASGIGLPRTQNPALRLAGRRWRDEDVVTTSAIRGASAVRVISGAGPDTQDIDDYLNVFPMSEAEQALIRSFACLSPHVAAAVKLTFHGARDARHPSWLLSRLVPVLKNPPSATEIEALSTRLPHLAAGEFGVDKAVAAYEIIERLLPDIAAVPGTVVSAEELPSLVIVLKDTVFAAEMEDFITRFLALYPAPEDSPFSDSEDQWRESPELAGFSEAARIAISRRLERHTSAHPPGSAINPLPLALAALQQGITRESLQEELASADFTWVTPVNWERIEDAALCVDEFSAKDLLFGPERRTQCDAEGRPIIANSLDALVASLEKSSLARLRALLAAVTEAGLATDTIERLARVDLPSPAVLQRHAQVLEGTFPLRADVITLARMAALESVTLDGALTLLKRYRPLIEPCWDLPERLPPGIADRELSPAERALLVETNLGNDQSRDWAELLVQASVISGLGLREIMDDALPLLTEACVPTDDLRRLCAARPGAITFDDLLILGCLQTWPDFTWAEVKTITRPFCRFPEDLPALVTHWTENASAWTDRSQRRPGGLDAHAAAEGPDAGAWLR